MGLAARDGPPLCPLGVTREDIKDWTLNVATLGARMDGLDKSITGFAPQIQKTREEMAALLATLKTKNGYIRRQSLDGKSAEPATVIVQFGKKQWAALSAFVAGLTVSINALLYAKQIVELVKGVFTGG